MKESGNASAATEGGSGTTASGVESKSDAAFYAAYERCEEADGAIMVATGCQSSKEGLIYIKGYIQAIRIANSFAVTALPDDPAAIMHAVLTGARPVLSVEKIAELVREGESAHREMQRLLNENPGEWVRHVSKP